MPFYSFVSLFVSLFLSLFVPLFVDLVDKVFAVDDTPCFLAEHSRIDCSSALFIMAESSGKMMNSHCIQGREGGGGGKVGQN